MSAPLYYSEVRTHMHNLGLDSFPSSISCREQVDLPSHHCSRGTPEPSELHPSRAVHRSQHKGEASEALRAQNLRRPHLRQM